MIKNQKVRNAIIGILLFIFAAAITIMMIMPFVYLVSGSFKSDSEFIKAPLKIIPDIILFDNYIKLFGEIPFGRQFINSMVVGVSATVLSILGSCVVAFGFSRYEFRFKKLLFGIMLATMFIPVQALTVPQFILFRKFNWINTYWTLLLPGMFSAFYIYLLTQLMKDISKEIFESATIDGCGDFLSLFYICIPLVSSGIGIVAVLRFMSSWNDFMTPLIYINKTELQTLPVGLQSLKSFQSTAYGTTMAGAVVASLPIILLLLVVGKKYFVSGLASGAVKG